MIAVIALSSQLLKLQLVVLMIVAVAVCSQLVILQLVLANDCCRFTKSQLMLQLVVANDCCLSLIHI